ncbi:MAG: hypothetical protein ACK4MD_02985 [Demequina sp.]
MNRPSLRTLAVVAGFLGVSMVVAGTASAMVGAPADAPIATAVELHQKDPGSVTPPIEADGSIAAPHADAPPPVEVGPAAIECSEAGVCEAAPPRVSSAPGADDSQSPPTAPQAHRDTRTPGSCDWPHPPARPAEGAAADEWQRTLDAWVDQWQATAQACGWHGGQKAGAQDGEVWKRHQGGHSEQHRHERDRGRVHPSGPERELPATRDAWTDKRDHRDR